MALDQKEEDSVYDFIYSDNRRIVQFLSQFSQYGHLTGLTRVDGITSSGGGGLNVGAAKIDKNKSTNENQTRLFDPQWLSPLKLLDELYQRDLIVKDISTAQVGNFILAKGQVVLLDLAMLKTSWSNPTIQKLIKLGQQQNKETDQNRQTRRLNNKQKNSQEQNEFDILIALLNMLPHTLQARIIGHDTSLWCTLDESAVIGRASDLILKHGALLDGEWNILGVLDATPYNPLYVSEMGETAEDILANIAETMVGQLAARLAPVARNILGRPPSAYGVTPVLIFRDTTARPSSE